MSASDAYGASYFTAEAILHKHNVITKILEKNTKIGAPYQGTNLKKKNSWHVLTL
jgi:hypothetical protein